MLLKSRYADTLYDRGVDNDTPLMRAAARGRWSTVTELIAIGAGDYGHLDELDIYDTSIRQQADRANHGDLATALSKGEERAWFARRERDRLLLQTMTWCFPAILDIIKGYASLLPIVI